MIIDNSKPVEYESHSLNEKDGNPSDMTGTKNSKKLLITLLIVSLLISITSAVYFAYEYDRLKTQQSLDNKILDTTKDQYIPRQETPKPTPTPEVSEIVPDTTKKGEWLSYTHAKFSDKPDWELPWKGFVLYYPSSWEIEVIREEDSPRLNLKISKANGDYLSISQGAGGYGRCTFPDESDYQTFEGMGQKYGEFITFNKGNNINWRLGEYAYETTWTHGLCELSEESHYLGSTVIGFAKIRVTTPESIKELEEILTKLEISN